MEEFVADTAACARGPLGIATARPQPYVIAGAKPGAPLVNLEKP
jgi:hypothetical protein